MTAATIDLQKRFRYHHGNLRDSLLTAALDILSTSGLEGLSLRALARKTGVTQTAPYTYFNDKDELLAALAEGGFQRLALGMAEAATGTPGTREKIEKLMTSYIQFADSNKPLFRIMFGRELADIKKYPTLAMTAGKGFALMSATLSALGRTPEETRFLTLAIFSLCHGLTSLIIDEKVTPQQFGTDSIETFVQKTTGLFSAQF